ncbi:MAG: hypothetical protein KDD46_04420 [Bdellovibrionales bacterium]|nr:hypothetical protein [Bdellovibrionales bacterium]
MQNVAFAKALFTLLLVLVVSSCGTISTRDYGASLNTNPNEQGEIPDPSVDEESRIYIYATAQPYTGNLGGRVGADAICQSDLPAALDGYEAHAILSYSVNEKVNDMPETFGLPTTQALYAYGTDAVIASDWNDFLDGTLLLSMEQAGVLSANTIYWTGNETNGSVSQSNCSGFSTSVSSNVGQIGNASRSDVGWTAFQESACNVAQRVLCIGFRL